ncbi:MAG: ribose-5-phosphate isomerase RpiA [Alphaproteobacteria bacterium]|nr:ribose-5-phosphate isomerase RpiA [Alphaproteobacteria bacterium]
MSQDNAKRLAAEAALAHVEPGMVLGLGTGSTAEHFLKALGRAIEGGLRVRGVPTSERTAHVAVQCAIPLAALDDVAEIDLTVDGADEIDPDLALIKGGGGALLREKIVAAASRRMIVIADRSKLVPRLGAFPLPVEVVPFGISATRRHLSALFAEEGLGTPSIAVRQGSGGHAFLTDGGHAILDCALGAIADPARLAARLSAVPGVVEHGLFIGLASLAILGGEAGHEIVSAVALPSA